MFKEKFKYYKSRCPPPKFEDVTDFLQLSSDPAGKVLPSTSSITLKNNCSKYGLIPTDQWKIYKLKNKPGVIFIVNPFTNQGQQYWVQKCLQEYTKKPNKLNLDPFNELQPGKHWWEETQVGTEESNKLLKKLRWATLGYHHNWDTKKYCETDCDDFPAELAELSKLVVEVIGDPAHKNYRAEAAIINFYHFDSTLSGHKDISEPNMESPLLSISFGQSAIFLVGGEILDDPVTAVFIHSGDIVVMSGQSRQCYHGVPRIVPVDQKPWSGGGWEQTTFGKYLETSRINMNIRQVLLPEFKESVCLEMMGLPNALTQTSNWPPLFERIRGHHW